MHFGTSPGFTDSSPALRPLSRLQGIGKRIPTGRRRPMRLGLFALLTICGFLIFALTMTFVPVLPVWANYAARAGFLVVFAVLWWIARDVPMLNCFRPVFFAYFTAVL